MKHISISLLVVLVLVTASFNHPVAAQPGPEDVARRFYAWYLHRLSMNDSNPLKNRTEALKYLTPEFLRRVPKLTREQDADVIICAQDWDKEWEKNIEVDAAAVDGARATTVVQLKGAEVGTVKIKVTLRQIAKAWRIDGTSCVDQ